MSKSVGVTTFSIKSLQLKVIDVGEFVNIYIDNYLTFYHNHKIRSTFLSSSEMNVVSSQTYPTAEKQTQTT